MFKKIHTKSHYYSIFLSKRLERQIENVKYLNARPPPPICIPVVAERYIGS
jgi:hypothetical protein